MDKSIIFPYEWTGTGYTPLSEEKFKELEPDLYYTLYFNKDQLDARNMERHAQWFQYARSQGIQHSRHHKFVLKHILSPNQCLAQFEEVGPEVLVYSGMYIIANDEAHIPLIREILSSRTFCEYLKLMGNDMAGGYKAVNTKIVKAFPVGKLVEDSNEG
jgi:adenine-specific DNA-methyltransferase